MDWSKNITSRTPLTKSSKRPLNLLGPGFNLAETLAQVESLVSFETKVKYVAEFFEQKNQDLLCAKIVGSEQ